MHCIYCIVYTHVTNKLIQFFIFLFIDVIQCSSTISYSLSCVEEEVEGGIVMDPIGFDDDPPPEPRDGWLLVRIHVPELNVYKCLQFPSERLVWDVKQQVLASLPKVSVFIVLFVFIIIYRKKITIVCWGFIFERSEYIIHKPLLSLVL